MQVTIEVTIRGISQLMTHNVRLSNPLDPLTIRLKTLTAPKKKTSEQLLEIMLVEARAGCWDTSTDKNGLFAINNEALIGCLKETARASKEGKTIERGVIVLGEWTPVHYGTKTVNCEELIKDPNNIDYRSVRIGSKRVMRSRPKIRPGWEATFRFRIDNMILEPNRFIQLLQKAGRIAGLGELRPRMGTFDVVNAKLVDDPDLQEQEPKFKLDTSKV